MDVGESGSDSGGEVECGEDFKVDDDRGALIGSESVSGTQVCANELGEESKAFSFVSLRRSWLSAIVLNGGCWPCWCDCGSPRSSSWLLPIEC